MAKKMMLVDANFGGTDLYRTKQHYSALDQNVSDVLQRTDLDDFGKLKLYQHTLNRFLINKQEVEGEVNKPVSVQAAEAKTKSFEQTYLDSLPADEREKTSGVIDDVIAYSPLRWNDKGELTVDGRAVKDSSLSKLVAYELKRRSATTGTKSSSKKAPAGFETFADFYRRANPTTATTRRSKRNKRKLQILGDWVSFT